MIFSLNTLLTAMRHVGCGDPHPVFAKGLRYIPPSAKKQVTRDAFDELSPYGFTQGDGFTPEFEDLLHLLDQPAQEYVAYARDTVGQTNVLVAVGGRSKVCVVLRGDQIELSDVDTHPADALVGRLPHYRPADIKHFSVPQEDFRNAEVSDIFDEERSREAQELDALFRQPHFGVGQLHADGRAVSYLDLEAGRVGIAAAEGYISVLPGENQNLSRMLKAATPR
ncbi:ESX secretion-associated protein EspG [Amycolatopsis kentuckyensis]|uniref:ESX secretion-associated protein EspG n=1 Tax=Amycolatopsis kentuckyensis TaxID=218823 RepID=UPI000A365216|nr:ESX secretion-associated protein EspG [Amycolatopsis kentuckyensis]